MSNPVHPKVLGGFAGGAAGGGIGSVLADLLAQSHYYQHLTVASQQTLVGLLSVGLALVGGFITSYLSKWEPAVSKEVGSVIHVLDPDETQAAAQSWLDSKWAALKAEVYGANPTGLLTATPVLASPTTPIGEAPKAADTALSDPPPPADAALAEAPKASD